MNQTKPWKPVLKRLDFKDYHPDYAGNAIMVCVNPEQKFLDEMKKFGSEYADRFKKLRDAYEQATEDQGLDKREGESAKARAQREFNEWFSGVGVPIIYNWFARLWSFGDEKLTVTDLENWKRVDPAFVTWIMDRSVEMIGKYPGPSKGVIRFWDLPDDHGPKYVN